MFIIHFQIAVAGALLDEGRERSGGADDEGLDGRPRHRVRFASSYISCSCFFVSAFFTSSVSHLEKDRQLKPPSQACWSPNSPSAGLPCWWRRWPRSGWTTIARSPSQPTQRSQGPGDRIIAWSIGNPHPSTWTELLINSWVSKTFLLSVHQCQHQSQTTIIQTFSATLSQARRVTSEF